MTRRMQTIAKIALTTGVILMPLAALAALSNPEVPVGGQGVTLSEVESIIRQIAQFLMVVGVIIAVIYIIWGGITYMAAGPDETKAKSARDRIKNGVIGAAVVLGIGVILQTVAGLLTRNFFQ